MFKESSGWQMAPISTMKPLIVSHKPKYWALVLCLLSATEREGLCAAVNLSPTSPQALRQTVQIEGSRWGSIWHDYRAASHLIKSLIENHNVSIRGQTIRGPPQCVTRLWHIASRLRKTLTQHTYWHCKHTQYLNRHSNLILLFIYYSNNFWVM